MVDKPNQRRAKRKPKAQRIHIRRMKQAARREAETIAPVVNRPR